MSVSTRPSEGQRPVVDPAPRWAQQSRCGGKYGGYGVACAGSAGYKRGSAPMKVSAFPRLRVPSIEAAGAGATMEPRLAE